MSDQELRAVMEKNRALEERVEQLQAENKRLNTALIKARMRNAITRTGRR